MSGNNYLILAIFVGGIIAMLYGVFTYHWFIDEISSVFLMVSIAAGLAARMSGREMAETALKSVAVVAPGAFMVGFATSIKVGMEMGNISDTIAFQLSEVLSTLPTYASAVSMSLAQCGINLMIPSGSGQALATLPIMIPLVRGAGANSSNNNPCLSNWRWSYQSIQSGIGRTYCYAGHVSYSIRSDG